MSLDRPGGPLPRCHICGQVLDRLRAARADVCERPACRHAALADAPSTTAVRRCRHCGAPLEGASARIDLVCRRPACRQHDDELAMRAQRERFEQAVRAQVSARVGGECAAAMPMVWIDASSSTLEPLPEELREAQIAHLRALAAELVPQAVAGGPQAAGQPVDVPSSDAGAPAPAEAQLCAWCGGRCCHWGRESHAYLRVEDLRRWLEADPGCTPDELVQAYAARLPERHVAGSCAYHGERGCTLDRAMRAEVCNRYACDGLRAVQDHAARDPGAWLFAMGRGAQAENLALADAAGVHPLPLPPQSRA